MNFGKAALVGARLGDQRQVRRQRAAIGRARGLLVGEWRGEVVGRPAGPLEHFALIVRAVLDLVFGRECRRLRGRIAGTAGIGEIAERDIGQRVAGGADFLVDLQPALHRAAIELAERTGKRPFLRRRRFLLLGPGVLRAAGEQRACERQHDHRRTPPTCFRTSPAHRRRSNSGSASAFRSGSSSGSRIRK